MTVIELNYSKYSITITATYGEPDSITITITSFLHNQLQLQLQLRNWTRLWCSHGSLIFQGTDFRCHLYSVTTCWMLKSVCFLFGKDYEDHGTINVDVRRRKVQHYKDIVIEYIWPFLFEDYWRITLSQLVTKCDSILLYFDQTVDDGRPTR